MKTPLRLLFLAGALASAVQAASTVTWEMSSYRDFLSGRFWGISLTRDGRLLPAPKLETLFASDQPVIWSLVQAPDGALYAGTGHRGRVYRIPPSGKAALLWTADQPEVFALALNLKGVLYAGTSPDGKVYRFENGKPVEYFAPKTKYIWALAFDENGALYVGTGDQGKIFRVTAPGQGEVYYETGQSHVTCLAFDSAGRLLAGSEPNGVLYRVSAKDKAFVLYDANLPEIRSIVAAPDGAIYAAALGGSLSRRTLGGAPSTVGVPSSVSVSATSTTVTVTDEGAQGGVEIKPKAEAAKPAAAAPAAPPVSPVLDVSGVEKSALYRIDPDNTVETLWSSKEENVYDLLVSGRQITFSTDGQGRIYRLSPDRKVTLLTQTNEGETIRLLAAGGGVLAATGDLGKIYRLEEGAGASGSYESLVHDSGTVARWGRLSWRGDNVDEGRVVFRTRSGNSARPDKTWSEWSEALVDAKGSVVQSPNARYIQWKAEFQAKAQTPVLDAVALAYLPQNTPPVLKSINVITQLSSAQAAKPATAQTPAATYSITVTDTGEAGPSTSAGTPTQTLARPAAEQIQITWQAEDPDGDRLVYTLYFRGEDEREWKLLKADLTENTYTLDADVLADGKYNFRVVASDSPVNPPGAARETELISAPTLSDHTPPIVTPSAPQRSGSHLEVAFEAVDAASPLRRCEYSLDAGLWIPMEAADGIIDSARERFLLRLDNLTPGEHLVVVRAVDAANNAGLAKVVVR
jgi:sugar lactone lactonase YvrE